MKYVFKTCYHYIVLNIFFRRILVLCVLVFIVCIIGVLGNLKNISSIEDAINISLGSVLIFIYFGTLPIIISSVITPLFGKDWRISDTQFKRDVMFGTIIILTLPIFFYLYTLNGLHAV